MSLRNIIHVRSLKWICKFIEHLWYFENYQKPRQGKTRQDQARQDKTMRHPDKIVSPGFEKYCMPCFNVSGMLQKHRNQACSVGSQPKHIETRMQIFHVHQIITIYNGTCTIFTYIFTDWVISWFITIVCFMVILNIHALASPQYLAFHVNC